MSIFLHLSLLTAIPPHSLSSSTALFGYSYKFLHSELSLSSTSNPPSTMIQMKRRKPTTYPGGLNKWKWKRRQRKNERDLLKVQLSRERDIYEMRKRAELKVALSEFESPREEVRLPPTLFSVSAEEQLKQLAGRFQRPEGFDLWCENDGPQLFHVRDQADSPVYFPKGVIFINPSRNVFKGGEDNLDYEVGKSSRNDVEIGAKEDGGLGWSDELEEG